jgi:mannose-6-phosphate isomerase-like protein (cupin superfamily)
MPTMNYLVNFDAMTWQSPMLGVRHKVHCEGARILRLVEYSREMLPHWCSKGHIGHIIQGRMEIEFKRDRQLFSTGDAIFIPSGPEHSHRAVALTSVVTALFVEDV